MATDGAQAQEGAAIEVDREFVDQDSTYGTDAQSELTSLSSSVTAYVRLPADIVTSYHRVWEYSQP